jgi:hypothetical protein
MKKIQEELILTALLRGKTVTPLEALEKWGCLRLAARIFDIRKCVEVRTLTRILPNGKRIAGYRLA